MANICGLNGGTGLALVTGLGIVDGFGDGIGLRPDLIRVGGEGFPDAGIGLTFAVCCIGAGIAAVAVLEVLGTVFDGTTVGNGIELIGSSLRLLISELWPGLRKLFHLARFNKTI